MLFASTNLSRDLENRLVRFNRSHDFVGLYKSYAWKCDTYDNGFPKILKLENEIGTAARNNGITIDHVIKVAKWGGLAPSLVRKIQSSTDVLNLNLYNKHSIPLSELATNPLPPLNYLDQQTKGIGPTYLSKVMRFALPTEYGAIDTRIVRVVGRGDPDCKKHDWLSLRVQKAGRKWSISRYQAAWPKDYAKWINILRFLASLLNNPDACQLCPHPEGFIEYGLRAKGLWACADIEMAIFSYASSCL